MGEPSGLSAVQTGHQIVERLGDRPEPTKERTAGSPTWRPRWPWPPSPRPCGRRRRAGPSLARPQEHGQKGVEEHPAGPAAERGGPPEKTAPAPRRTTRRPGPRRSRAPAPA